MNDWTGDLGVLVFGIGVTIMFLIGYFYTIYEFNHFEDQRERRQREKNAEYLGETGKEDRS